VNAIPITNLDDAKTMKQINAKAQRLYGRLKALKPPSSLRDERDRWFAALDAEQKLVAKIGHGKATFTTTHAQAAQLDRAQAKVDAAARALGVTKCATKR
jgi:hypothetical protein